METDDDGDATTTGTTTSGGGATPVPKREVYQRNPFGNVAETGNLLWDGDFEFRPPFASQYGWYQAESSSLFGVGNTKQVVGVRCRSGLKCARLETDNVLLGLAVSSEGNDLSVSFWAKPDSGTCLDVEAWLISQETTAFSDAILPESDSPAAGGWCHFLGLVAEQTHAQYLYIHNRSDSDVIIDDAVIVPAHAERQMALSATLVPDPELAVAVRAWMARERLPRILPKSPGQLAWEKHMERRWRIAR